jgi:hypothetical protein
MQWDWADKSDSLFVAGVFFTVSFDSKGRAFRPKCLSQENETPAKDFLTEA